MALSNAERQARARVRNKGERNLQRLSQWISRPAYLALGRLALFRGLSRSRLLEDLILREEESVNRG